MRLTLRPVSAKDTSLLFLLSSANRKGKKHNVLSSYAGFLNKLCWEHSKSEKQKHLRRYQTLKPAISGTAARYLTRKIKYCGNYRMPPAHFALGVTILSHWPLLQCWSTHLPLFTKNFVMNCYNMLATSFIIHFCSWACSKTKSITIIRWSHSTSVIR